MYHYSTMVVGVVVRRSFSVVRNLPENPTNVSSRERACFANVIVFTDILPLFNSKLQINPVRDSIFHLITPRALCSTLRSRFFINRLYSFRTLLFCRHHRTFQHWININYCTLIVSLQTTFFISLN
jgi:hypothetical protein